MEEIEDYPGCKECLIQVTCSNICDDAKEYLYEMIPEAGSSFDVYYLSLHEMHFLIDRYNKHIREDGKAPYIMKFKNKNTKKLRFGVHRLHRLK